MSTQQEALMSISPPSDIVLDVARNADADLAAIATRRLETLASTQAADRDSFGSTLSAVGARLPQEGYIKASTLGVASRAPAASSGAHREKDIAEQFEASVLGAFVNDAMPKNMSSFYGQGSSGEIWKSMLSDQIAHQLAKSGSLGIARRLFATHPIKPAASRSGAQIAVDKSLQDAAQSSALPLSSQMRFGPDMGVTVSTGSRRS